MTSSQGSPAAGPPAAGGSTESLYVYGVVSAADAGAIAAAVTDAPRPVRGVSEGDLAALVSPLPADTTPGRREDLEAHDRVLAQVIARGTVIPMRFGVVMDGEDIVRRDLLGRHADELKELLHVLDGHVQMSLKAYYAEDVLVREAVAANPELARRSAALRGRPDAETHRERLWIGETVARAVGERRERDRQALLERISPVVAAVDEEPPANERMALNAQLLVRRDARERLDAVVRELSDAQADRLAFRYVGPLPPYSFADVALDPGEDAWD